MVLTCDEHSKIMCAPCNAISDTHPSAHARVPFPYLQNGWTNCAETLYVLRDLLAMPLTRTNGGVQMHVRTCVFPFPYLGSGWKDCAEMCYMGRDFTSYACYTSHGWGTNICTCAISGFKGGFCWNMVCCSTRSESYTAMSKVYLHVCKCKCTSFYAFLLTSARSSTKMRLTCSIISFLKLKSTRRRCSVIKWCVRCNI